MSFLRNLYFFQGQKYTSFGKNILHRQSASLGHSATGHSVFTLEVGYKIEKLSSFFGLRLCFCLLSEAGGWTGVGGQGDMATLETDSESQFGLVLVLAGEDSNRCWSLGTD